jgi:hypothetical protein
VKGQTGFRTRREALRYRMCIAESSSALAT